MKVRYTFTTDIKEIAEVLKLHISHFNSKSRIDELLFDVERDLEQPLNLPLLIEKINNISEKTSTLSVLLNEVLSILTACQEAENAQKPQAEDNSVTEEAEQQFTEQQTEQTNQLQSAMGQLTNIVSSLQEIKDQ
jgi:hypothetical protein